MEKLSIVIIGGGSIGVSFALLFAKNKVRVQLYEYNIDRLSVIKDELLLRIKDLNTYGLIAEGAEKILQRISLKNELTELDVFAHLVIECVPEKLELKRDIFLQLDTIFSESTIISSASSALMISQVAKDLPGRNRCLITHPGNPPHLIPIIELVPADFTDPWVVEFARSIFENIGQMPVLLNKEIEGFIFNRLQGAVLREAYSLVKEGIASVEDIDKVMTSGLGIRWAIIGPFETIDLNTRGGIISHAEKMGDAYARMGRAEEQIWAKDLVENVNAQRRKLVPIEEWEERIHWRDNQIMKFLRYKNDI